MKFCGKYHCVVNVYKMYATSCIYHNHVSLFSDISTDCLILNKQLYLTMDIVIQSNYYT